MSEPNVPSASTQRILDWIERVVLLAAYLFLVYRTARTFSWETLVDDLWKNVAFLLSEGMLLVFVLIRRKANAISFRPLEWGLAMAASSMTLLVSPGGAPLISTAVGGVLLLLALLFQLYAKLSLGRSFGVVPANRGIVDHGPYRVVRHPIYAGYLLNHITYFLLHPTGWNGGVYVLFYALQVPRLLAEERLLSQDESYRKYMEKVRYRLLPGIF